MQMCYDDATGMDDRREMKTSSKDLDSRNEWEKMEELAERNED